MRKFIHLALLAAVAVLSSQSTVHGAELRANINDENQIREERIKQVKNIAVERELQRRRRNGGSGKGKGGSGSMMGSKSKGRNGLCDDIRFLPDRIDPIPFVNCIPLPPGFDCGGGKKKGMKMSMMGSKSGKGGKGKGGSNRRNNRDRGMIRERLLKSSSSRDRRQGRNRGANNRNGARRNGNGGGGNRMMRMNRLPYCPGSAPTFFPTALPSFTPFPTSTPLPSITPFPSFTPLPTFDDGPLGPPTTTVPGAPTVAPGPGAPTLASAPTVAPGPTPVPAPISIPAGTERILVESQLEYGFFAGEEVRAPTQEEIDGLMVQTSLFYDEIVRAAFPNLNSFEAVYVPPFVFDAAADLPVLLDFDANAFFETGTAIPTPAEVFAVMEAADYQNYITMFVWNSSPGETGLFFNTQEVAYNARVTQA